MAILGQMRRAPRPGYREHDHWTDWQECDTCHRRTGRGYGPMSMSEPADTPNRYSEEEERRYYDGDPDACPRPGCDGRMCLPVEF